MRLIQQELDQIRCTRNSCRIKTTPTTDPVGRPPGRPDILYYITDGQYIKDYCQNYCTEDLEVILDEYYRVIPKKSFICTDEFYLDVPNNSFEALSLVKELLHLYASVV